MKSEFTVCMGGRQCGKSLHMSQMVMDYVLATFNTKLFHNGEQDSRVWDDPSWRVAYSIAFFRFYDKIVYFTRPYWSD